MADQYILTGTPTSQLSTAEELVTILPPGGSVSSGQNNYDTGTGFWLGNDGGTPKFSIGSSSGNKLTWNGSTLSITGSITATTGTIGGWTIGATTITGGNVTLDSTGNIRAGQTDYNTGVGFWLGRIGSGSGDTRFSVGNPLGGYMAWDGTSLTLSGSLLVPTSLTIGTVASTSLISLNSGADIILTANDGTNLSRVQVSELGITLTTPNGTASSTGVFIEGKDVNGISLYLQDGNLTAINSDGSSFTDSVSGSDLDITIGNNSNTASSGAQLRIYSGGTSAGDPFIFFQILSGGVWSIGSDNSDSDNFKVSRASSIGTNDALTIDSSNNTTLAGTLTVSGTGTSSFAGLNSLFGSTSISTFSGSATPKLQVVGTTNFYESSFGLVRYASGGNVPSVGPFCYLALSRGTTGSHTVVQDGDLIGGFTFEGSDGDEFLSVAQIRALVDGTPGNNDMPGRLQFWTCADGAASPRVVVEIRQNADVVLNATGSALATTATGGFTYIPTCAGTPTGTPTNLPTGALPMVIDSTNNRLYFYSGGAWRNAGP